MIDDNPWLHDRGKKKKKKVRKFIVGILSFKGKVFSSKVKNNFILFFKTYTKTKKNENYLKLTIN